ncbi:MAG TPA: glycosyl hydrolase family 28 protein [Verrucomicrobiae bacterium]
MSTTAARRLTTMLFLAAALVSPAQTLPILPRINTNNVVVVTNAPYNAIGDGTTNNELAISNAIVKAASGGLTNGTWGGTVEIPGPGTYLCGPLNLKSSVNLQVDAGATLQMLPITSWPSAGTPFIFGTGLTNVEISGNGTIDGQGLGWWVPKASSRPNFIQIDKSRYILFQNITLQNPPTFTLYLKNSDGNVTINGININTVPSSPNTDGMDVGSTNMLIENSHISDGDDNIELGGSSYPAAFIMITNCLFGSGHGVSMGSDLGASVHDVTVINCVFTNTQNGIKMKSDNDRGGLVQNIYYYNLSMTNLTFAPIVFFSYYNTYGADVTSKGITPAAAAANAPASVTSKEPAYRNIIVSNLTATAAQPGMIWGRTEYPATNILLEDVNITASDPTPGNASFALYNAVGVEILDSSIQTAGGAAAFELFNAQAIFTNTAPTPGFVSLNGAYETNALSFYNQSAWLSDPNFFGVTALTLGGSILSNSVSATLPAGTPVNFILGTNATSVMVSGNLALNSGLNITNGPGFGPGTNTLFMCTGTLSGNPVLGITPVLHSYTYSLMTNATQANFVVTAPAQPKINNFTASGTNLILSAANGVTNGVCYLLSTTNLALPLGQWKVASTNPFNASGVCSITNTVSGSGQTYYQLEIP